MNTRFQALVTFGLFGGFLGACASTARHASAPPLAGVKPADELIQPEEKHFAHLWQITKGGENAEGYWSFAGDRISLQRRFGEQKCDRIFVTDARGSDHTGIAPLAPVSNGKGVTTCAYFLPGDREVLYASTQAAQSECPPPPDRADGYVWALHPEYDIYVHDLATGAERRLTDTFGYDAEGTVSPLGDRIVFTSDRSGDLELWTCKLDGSDLKQVTNELGYDGGAFFSHDGKRLVFRATHFVEPGPNGEMIGTREQYVDLLKKHKIRPHRLDLYVCDADGSNRRQVTDLGGASWAPYFTPDDRRILFSSNHHDTNEPKFEFDIFAVDVDGSHLERITTYKGFDSFPIFSPDGKWLVFASNRGGTEAGETNLFVAEWR
jgi:dipeptidyl aminopeptidase/acylaminoacyl peptidase